MLYLIKYKITVALKNVFISRSGTEEEYSELDQLCEDISSYRHDINEMKMQEKDLKTKKGRCREKKAADMRVAAMKGLACM